MIIFTKTGSQENEQQHQRYGSERSVQFEIDRRQVRKVAIAAKKTAVRGQAHHFLPYSLPNFLRDSCHRRPNINHQRELDSQFRSTVRDPSSIISRNFNNYVSAQPNSVISFAVQAIIISPIIFGCDVLRTEQSKSYNKEIGKSEQ